VFDTRNAKPPDNAVVLFDGSSLDGWTNREGGPAEWKLVDGAMEVVPGKGDIGTKERFRDHFLHLEFRLSDMPEAEGQAKSNSGVFLQGRFEIQVLDSSGWDVPGLGDCGAIYGQSAPLANACRPAMEWQTYDVVFRAPRCEGAVILAPARVTVLHNGVVVQNNVTIPDQTGAPTDRDYPLPGHLRLQDHGNVVWYRNIWAVHLPREGSNEYAPRMRDQAT
jgi:hypothetical protein